ncbi:hypothetical protein BpHYR1_025957 [Brachionus plicatilis]|uniref:Uncharacterized protein n=1 Tax=Brachionus plicatilis TaxID=10195 RepID=A0A3M7SMX1_BRAPC|nr:hypothetical protein BpHYR1_025957 [Brachionus plicatilis]
MEKFPLFLTPNIRERKQGVFLSYLIFFQEKKTTILNSNEVEFFNSEYDIWSYPLTVEFILSLITLSNVSKSNSGIKSPGLNPFKVSSTSDLINLFSLSKEKRIKG